MKLFNLNKQILEIMLKNKEDGAIIMTDKNKTKHEKSVSTLVKEYIMKIPVDLRDFNYKVVKFYLTVMAWASHEENPTHLLSNAINFCVFESLQAARNGHAIECLIWRITANSFITDHDTIDKMNAKAGKNSFANLDYAENIKKYRRELARYDIDLPNNHETIE